jgi:Tol biopolymer transport system component
VRRGLPTRFTTAADDEVTAVWAPDGSRIIFNRDEGVPPRLNLYEGDANNPGKEMPLRIDDRAKWPTAVSPDGRYLLYDREGLGGTDMWLLPLEGERTPRALFATAANQGASQFSPDGRWIAYHSNESGRFEVYVVPFPGPGRPVRVSGEGGRWPRWRRDQKALFFLNEGASLSSLSDNELMAADMTVREGSIDVGAVRTLFDAPIPGSGRGVPYAVTPDGQRFLLNAMVEGVNESSISLIVNWPAILRDPEQR